MDAIHFSYGQSHGLFDSWVVKHHVDGIDLWILVLDGNGKKLILFMKNRFWEVTFLDSSGKHSLRWKTAKVKWFDNIVKGKMNFKFKLIFIKNCISDIFYFWQYILHIEIHHLSLVLRSFKLYSYSVGMYYRDVCL